jgi:NadR type nicotinamide-nucleotide adenylyltransferase
VPGGLGLEQLAAGGGMTLRICLAGVESTGKTVLGQRLAAEHGGVFMPEYGRAYCEARGVDGLTMEDLHIIAAGHASERARLLAKAPRVLIEDTDIVMTCAWAAMLFGAPDADLRNEPADAGRYLMFDAGTPWIADGTRLFGTRAQRARFDSLIRAEFARRGIVPVEIAGNWQQRYLAAVSVLQHA